MLDKILRASLTITIIYYFPLLLSRAAEAAAAYCVGVVAIGGEVFVEYALCNALAFCKGYIAVRRVIQPQHNVPFVVLIVIIISVDNAYIVYQRQPFFYRNTAADMHAQKLVILHIGFHAGCHHLQRMRLNGNVLRQTDIVPGRHFCFAFRYRKFNFFKRSNFFKTT